jgi:ATP-dependent helicase HrpA
VWDGGRKHPGLVIERRLEYFGFELERETEVMQEFPAGMEDEARDVLAEALATGQARHPSVRRNQAAVDEVREVYRRSGGRTAALKAIELARLYRPLLNGIASMNDFWHGRFELDHELESVLPIEDRAPYLALPSHASVRGRDVQIDYDVEDGPRGVARLVLPEKMARTLVEEELPSLDRPIRFTVPRGQKGTVRATTLDELQDLLDQPWAPPPRPGRKEGRDGRADGRRKKPKRRR